MAKIFLDTNIFIDLIEKPRDETIDAFANHELFISPLSIHVLLYVSKQKIPYNTVSRLFALFSIVSLDAAICDKAILGPTIDFEDNVQLHSAAEAVCDIFLTRDKELLQMKYFGKMIITSQFTKEI